jgi:ATP-binding cassette subfamily B protein
MARALLRGKALYLLDEATSAVDAKSERDITLRLIEVCRRRREAVIAVTHRLQWLDAFDEVWFVENGQIRWRGPHAKLMAEPTAARYRDFCRSHADDFRDDKDGGGD